MISQIVKIWQLFCKIQDGGNGHLELLQLCISDVFDMFQIEVPMFLLILVTIGQIVKKWQQFFVIQPEKTFQNGGRRHLKKYNSDWNTITRNEFLVLNFQSKMYFIGASWRLGEFTLGSSNIKAILCKKSILWVHILAVFWTGDSLIVNLKAPNSERARVSNGKRLLSH